MVSGSSKLPSLREGGDMMVCPLVVLYCISSDSNQNLKDDDLHYHLEVPDPKYQTVLNSHMVKLYLNISLCLTKLHRK